MKNEDGFDYLAFDLVKEQALLDSFLENKKYLEAAEKLKCIVSFCENTDSKNFSDYWDSKLLLGKILLTELGDRKQAKIVFAELNQYFFPMPCDTLRRHALETYIGSLILLAHLQTEDQETLNAKNTLLQAKDVCMRTLGPNSVEVETINSRLEDLNSTLELS